MTEFSLEFCSVDTLLFTLQNSSENLVMFILIKY